MLSSMSAALLTVPALSACGSSGSKSSGTSNSTVELSFFYPVEAAGPLATTMTALVNDFNKAHPKIQVKPSFTGDYATNLTKLLTTVKGGNPPDVAILSLGDQLTMLDQKALQPLNELADETDISIPFDDFYPAFLDETKQDGATYGLPFQRSACILYYNADALNAVGVTAAPATWDDVVSAGTKLMAKKQVQWGVQFPTGIWQYQGLAIEAGQDLNASDLSHVNFNTPAAVTALQWLVDLSAKYGVSPKGVIDGLVAPTAFTGGKVGILYNTSGSLTSVIQQSKFKVGTAFMPKKEAYGSPTGGGNLYILKDIPTERKRAALTFLEWMTQPAQGARWSVASGYIPARKAIVSTDEWKAFLQKYPQANTATDELQYAVPSLRSHASNEVGSALLDAMQAAVSGKASAASALSTAQKKADSILAQYR